MNSTDERLKNLPIERVKNILLSPATEWPVIAAETTTPKDLYLKYIMILAAIPAVAMFIGGSLVGYSAPFIGTIQVAIGSGIAHAILQYAMSLGMVWVMALIIDGLAPKFGSEKNFLQSLKLVAYAMTPAWIGGILYILPSLSLLAILASIYALYLLYIGLAPMKNPPTEKQASYFGVSLVCAILASLVMGVVTAALRPAPPMPAADASAKALQEAFIKQIEKTGNTINKQLEEAGKSK